MAPPNSASPTSHPKNATAAAAAAAAQKAQKAEMAARALAQKYNVNATKYFAAAMAGFILLFTIFNWSRFLYSRYASKSVKRSSVVKAQVSLARLARRTLNHPAPGFKSIGHALVVLIYLAINVSTVVTNIDRSSVFGASKRLGWMCLANIAFLTFLALKNTPLAFLTAYSYETLNPLHQIAGYTTITCGCLHAIFQSVTFAKFHELSELIMVQQVSGIIAVGSMLVILTTALAIRRVRYEAFYVTHITMYMLILINIGLHRPDITKKSLIFIIVAGSMWFSDRLLRASRIIYNSRDNRATILPLPCGGTRIVLRRSPSRAVPGAHCFLWVPKIRLFETHPFTIVRASATSLELVISAYDGFTHELHEYAVKNPGVSLRASIDGPYGALPNFPKVADKLVLIGGGSGASFTLGVALDAVKRLPESSKTTIDFTWAVREPEVFSWFNTELNELRSSPRVNISLFSTTPISAATTGTQTPTSTSPADEEKRASLRVSAIDPSSPGQDVFNTDIEKKAPPTPKTKATPWDSSMSLDATHGRPDVPEIIRSIVATTDKDERIVIAACGPGGMMKDVRSTATRSISVSGPSIELHLEQFGW